MKHVSGRPVVVIAARAGAARRERSFTFSLASAHGARGIARKPAQRSLKFQLGVEELFIHVSRALTLIIF